MKDIRIGIVGMGVQGQLYAKILTGAAVGPGKPEGCRLTAISTTNKGIGEAYAAKGVFWYDYWPEMLYGDKCDAVIITVPHYLHPEIAEFALDHGKHVLCEKPAGIRASDVRSMLQARDRNPGMKLAMLLNQRTNPLFKKLRETVASGELGQLRRSSWIINSWWRPDSYYASNAWRGTWKGEGGGVVVNQLPHQLDLWLGFTGMPEEVYALNIHGAWRNIPVENDVTVTASYPGGATGTLISCTHDPLGTDRLELDFDKGKILVEDSARATVYRFKETEAVWNQTISHRDMPRLNRIPGELWQKEEITADQPTGGAYVEIFENFAAHILRGEPLIADGEAGLRQVQLANAIQLSGWKNAPVKVPCDEDEFNAQLQKRIDSEG